MSDARTCGGCTFCCSSHPVEDLAKPPGVRCKHCNIGKGCRIYARRPYSCRQYKCAWLANPHIFADALRPDRCGFTMDYTEDGKVITLLLDPKLMRQYRRQVLLEQLVEELRRDFSVIVVLDAQLKAPGAIVMYPHASATVETMQASIDSTHAAEIARTQEAIADGRIKLAR